MLKKITLFSIVQPQTPLPNALTLLICGQHGLPPTISVWASQLVIFLLNRSRFSLLFLLTPNIRPIMLYKVPTGTYIWTVLGLAVLGSTCSFGQPTAVLGSRTAQTGSIFYFWASYFYYVIYCKINNRNRPLKCVAPLKKISATIGQL